MDTLMNAGKAAGLSAANGRKVRTNVITSRSFLELGNDIEVIINNLLISNDILLIDTVAVSTSPREYIAATTIYYAEKQGE